MNDWFGAHLVASAAEAGSRPALVFQDRSWTYAELDLAIRNTVARLHGFGVRAGDRVVMQGAARPEALVTMFAVTRMGAVLVPVHPQLTGAELAVIREETAPRAVVAEAGFAEAGFAEAGFAEAGFAEAGFAEAGFAEAGFAEAGFAEAGFAEAGFAEEVLTWEVLHPVDEPSAPAIEAPPPPAGDDIAVIAFTSGTSGRPKGVALTHDNLRWSMVNGLNRLPVGPDDVALVSTPLAHVAVLGGLPQYTWARRGTVVLAPKFDPDLFIDLVRDHRATCAFAVPAMAALLTRHPRFPGEDLDGLRWLLSGGAPAQTATRERLHERGIAVVDSYGLTETCAGVTYSALDTTAVAGHPAPHVELRVVDPAGAPAPVGTAGEIWVRGPSVASAYWTSAGTRPVTDGEGWFRTGDRGLFDSEGRLEVAGRVKDTIITGGENVDPAEVENALTDFPGVVEVAVSGTPDPVWGELVTAFLVTDAGEPTLDDLRAHLDGRLSRHKWPRRLCVVPALPRGATGKLQRQRLTTLLDV
ncbi:class I adenylate-forming enzyme family protein [Streptomyces deccanensis]|uniref:class I adenylate-forming enzyme family protein n=1 Tax=Streptomyces deccanensis TaxID=424188 RepID=UPI001EFABAB9|nr:AMP-binding protein [Streptomyces deccanensis]ULR47972.1 AMP-binding protein [Streptomyces deccanensis]